MHTCERVAVEWWNGDLGEQDEQTDLLNEARLSRLNEEQSKPRGSSPVQKEALVRSYYGS